MAAVTVAERTQPSGRAVRPVPKGQHRTAGKSEAQEFKSWLSSRDLGPVLSLLLVVVF